MTATSRRVRYRRPPMYAKQERALFDPRRFVCIEASTKAGKTTGALFWLTEQAVLAPGPGRVYWWVAPSTAQARIAYRRFKLYNRRTEGRLWKGSDSLLEVTLANGNVMQFKTAEKADLLYGDDVYAAVLDEASRCRRESWTALYSTLTATQGPCRLIGNVRGRKNVFYELSRKGQGNEPGYGYYLLSAWDAVEGGVLARAAVENARRDLPESVFNELFLGIPTDDGGNPFGQGHIERAKRKLTGRPVVCWGVDLGKALDWTVLLGLDADKKVAELHRFQRPWVDTLRECRILLRAPSVMDGTGVGDPIVEMLQRPEGSRLGVKDLRGFLITGASKQPLLERLAVAIQDGSTSVPDDGYAASEYEAFEYEVTRTHVRYSAPVGQHDDVVLAHALALEAWEDRLKQPTVHGSLVTL